MIRTFADHPTAANLLLVVLFVIGVVALPTLLRETFPDFSADRFEVRVVWPGAGAGDVEEAICQRIEDALDQMTDIAETTCEAAEGLATATVEMAASGEIGRFLTELKTEVEAIDSFPDEAEDPVVRQLERTDAVISIAITGPMSEPDLKVYAEVIKERLTTLTPVTQVAVRGFSDRQIRIEPDLHSLRALGLSINDLAELVERQSLDLPAGALETRERDLLVRFADQREEPLGFADLMVLSGEEGAIVTLGQIARITDRFERPEARVLIDGQRAALLEVTKTAEQDILEILDAVTEFVAEAQATAPPGVTFHLTRDVASVVRDRLDMLVVNAAEGLALVVVVLWLFFSLRLSFWVAMGLPASFLGSIFVLSVIGYSINMMTMVALLIAIGLIMDDAIVIAENVASHFARHGRARDAAADGTREVAMGVVSSFLTSACVFTPLAFLTGDIGDVLKVVPVVLLVTLAVSLIEAFWILPSHLSHSLHHGGAVPAWRQRFEAGFARLRDRGLGGLVDRAVEWRYLTIGLVGLAFLASLTMVAGGQLKFRAFPELDGDVAEARILLPQGTPLARTEAVVTRVTTALAEVDAALAADLPGGTEGQAPSLVRAVLVEFDRNTDAGESGPHVATVTADLVPAEQRPLRVDDLLNAWRAAVGTPTDVIALTFTQPQVGPAGRPIEIRLQGTDLDDLNGAAMALEDWLSGYRGVFDLNRDVRPGKPEIALALEPAALAMGLDGRLLAAQVSAALQGVTASEIQVGTETFEVDLRLAAGDMATQGDLDDLPITLPDGSQVPLAAVATVTRDRGLARIVRIDGVRTVTLTGDVDTAMANVGEILGDTAERFLPQLAERYPAVRVVLEGEAASSAETGASLLRGLLLGLIGIYVLLSLQFRSYVEPIIVMVAIPLAGIGVIWGHLVLGLELSMPSMMGYVSLAGIVVNDSILLVTFVKRNARAMDLGDAARLAARERFRPVLLTSLTTIAGLLPLLFEQSLQAQVLVPLVASLAFGLLASTVLVLILLPCLYTVLHDLGLSTTARQPAAEEAPATS